MNIKEFVEGLKRFLTKKETISVFILVVFILGALSSIFISPQVYQRSMYEGDIAIKDVYAPYDFTYNWEVDEEKTEKARKEAAKKLPYVLKDSESVKNEVESKIKDFYIAVETEKAKGIPAAERVANLVNISANKIPEKNIKILLDYYSPRKLSEKTLNAVKDLFLMGIVSGEDMTRLKAENISEVIVSKDASGIEIGRKLENLLNISDEKSLNSAVAGILNTKIKADRKIIQAASSVVLANARPNLSLDLKKTEELKNRKIKEVKPVYHQWSVRKNEIIVEKGTRINARHVAEITDMRNVFQKGRPAQFFVGILLLFVMLGVIGTIYLTFIHRMNFLHYTKKLSIVLVLILFIIVLSDFIIRTPQPSYFIPLASMSMLIMLLVDFYSAFLATTLVSIFIGVITGGRIDVMFVLFTGGIVGMWFVKEARKRADILRAGFLVGIAKFLAITCMGLVGGIEFSAIINDGFWGLASGIISGFIVMGVLHLFENIFKVATNISLLELSDLNHPALKKLSLEAPGTYHHSITVGNLAEAACDAIEANSLLARVGAYYHDIGKIQKAEYFSENEMGSGSKHKNLAPSMSALIIAKHVKDGVEEAKKYKLSSNIIEFIAQHHGDSLISFFYQKALEKAEKDEQVTEENFRYPGPRPQTKETAIVLLADAVEAASRSLEEPTPASIRNLVRKIINNKFIDGQLDECELTLKDMHKIADSFVRILQGIYHTRLSYPEEKKNGEKEDLKTNGDNNKSDKQKQKKKD